MRIKYQIKYVGLFVTMILATTYAGAQSGTFAGKISAIDQKLTGVTVFIPSLNKGTTTDLDGKFTLSGISTGTYQVKISFIGYLSISDSISIREGRSVYKEYALKEDVLNLGEIVVTGSRNEIERYNSPVIINTISNRTFEATQSISISEGLSFSPGLRVENNCQNCGFTQLRMNGLDGPYSQILINSRPIFSALAGVYGLEMLPANMVERIEIVRGGGSVMYGGNAIAGTVNIITKDPVQNTFEVGLNQSFINLEAPDRTVTFNGSVVSDELDKGVSFFGFNRNRAHWDANADGFSEIVKLKNNTFGFDAFWNTSERSKLKVGAYYISEFRRGGNRFDLFPHQTDLTEQLQHDIISTSFSFEQFSKDYKHKIAAYTSFQVVNRDSYYGGGGRVIQPGDTLNNDDILAINAYGTSQDFSIVGGLQYNYEFSKKILLIAGVENIYNHVKDQMPGYGRMIDQQVNTWGSYAQLEIKPIERLTLLIGGRYDNVHINGSYDLTDQQYHDSKILNVLVPRLSAMYVIKDNLKLRTSFAQGYRGPQAFDEDLHIETVGGSARFIRLAPTLQTEKSNSLLVSLNYDKVIGSKQMNIVAEGFYTQLNNPFILSDQTELPNGVAVITKRNGESAYVSGVNLEANIAFSRKLVFQSGATIQAARYTQAEEIWTPDVADELTPATLTTQLLRTPSLYGYFTLVYNPSTALTVSYSGIITGAMDVAHVINPETEQTVIKSTPVFFENNIKIGYTFTAKDISKLQLFGGVQNITNSYQKDFDSGMTRDAGYVYGPLRPRTLFIGLNFGI